MNSCKRLAVISFVFTQFLLASFLFSQEKAAQTQSAAKPSGEAKLASGRSLFSIPNRSGHLITKHRGDMGAIIRPKVTK